MRRFGVWIGGLAIVYALLGVAFYWGGYDTEECRRLKGIVGDAQLQDENRDAGHLEKGNRSRNRD